MNAKGKVMRKFLISLLLAGVAATPAIAQDDARAQMRAEREAARSDARESRQEARDSRQDSHVDRSSESDRPQYSAPSAPEPAARVEGGHAQFGGYTAPEHFGGGGAVRPDYSGGGGHYQGAPQAMPGEPRGPRTVYAPQGDSRDSRDSVRDWRSDERQQMHAVRPTMIERGATIRDRGDLRQPDHPLPGVLRTRTPVVSNEPRPGTQPPPRETPGTQLAQAQHSNWHTDWRHDSRYNWADWRRRHHSLFHVGFYYDPYGWDYSPFQIGWRLWPSYYSYNYWLNDPYDYRLPYAPPGYRWVRYYNDALLVDMWDGQVEDVIYDFFW
jgi:Ni/Co efflux regulator RcnB